MPRNPHKATALLPHMQAGRQADNVPSHTTPALKEKEKQGERDRAGLGESERAGLRTRDAVREQERAMGK
jgi:hypothetical protein